MDRSSDKEKSSKRRRDDHDHDRDSTKSHRDRDHKHRSRDKDRDRDDGHRRHHHRSDRESRHKSSKLEDRESSRDRESSYDPRDDDRQASRDRRERSREPRIDQKSSKHEDGELSRERSYDARDEREGSRERRKRERSYDERGTEESEYEARKKRKERGESEDRVSQRAKKPSSVLEEKRDRRRFDDKAKDEDAADNGDNLVSIENAKRADSNDFKFNKEVYDESIVDGTSDGGNLTGDGATKELATKKSTSSTEPYMAPVHPLPTKVSSISNTNENKGVSISRSHEVPGKSSTDGSSSAAGKSGSLSLDALTKARKALQMQKELSEKLKKIPLLSKGTSASLDGSSLSGSKEGLKGVFSSTEAAQGIVPSTDATNAVSAGSLTNSSSSSAVTAASVNPFASGVASFSDLTSVPNIEAVKRAQELAAKMGFRQDPQFAPLINLFPGQVPAEVAVPQKPTKAPVLRVDALGREIDEHGNVVNVTKPSNLSTLKVNINKQKKESFQILKPELDVDPESNPHYDPRMGIDKNKLLRPKRMTFQFVEEGKWSKEAEMLKLKSQFGEERAKDMKARQALHAKAKAAPDINPNLIEVSERVITKEKPKDPIPEIEWWDKTLLPTAAYGEMIDGVASEFEFNMEKITIYIEHPLPVEPPAEAPPPPPQPLKLTKKEQKKLRTQRRLGREKDKQEMIRQGLIEPPKPKVKMSNLMKVLGSEATQDPTRLEKEIRTAAAEREQAHIDRNIARKLTPAERREKKERKLFEDPSTLETIVSVYRINDLSHKKSRFKVDVNAHENRMTGTCVITEGINVVVVEGGSKSIKRYGKLMLKRINWAEAVEEEEGDDNEEKPLNKCVLVWQGSVAKPSFNKFSVHECVTEAAARKFFADAGVGHYWDLAVNFTDDQM